ncbi:uncharacterized protein LOC124898074 [Capsicum annuum]|uniref:uncharacterized protein LOC124898074 n=1 Tax=Capsicum annuum TaxID=4072 RepID=UPI001FB0DC93|nr:uncharacterized protein LOC124898074 [Capsicum annuum]
MNSSYVSTSTTTSALSSSSPLYLLPFDFLETILVNTIFNGIGYESWRKGMKLGLSCKNKLGLINGSVPKPQPTSPLFEPWNRCNDMVVAWILNSLDKEITETVMYTEFAEKFWKDIEQRFVQVSGLKIFQIRKDISSITQDNSNIASYFNRIKRLWNELCFSISYPECECGCKEAFQKLDEEQREHQFLSGLNDSYSTIRRNILLMKPLPDVDNVFHAHK